MIASHKDTLHPFEHFEASHFSQKNHLEFPRNFSKSDVYVVDLDSCLQCTLPINGACLNIRISPSVNFGYHCRMPKRRKVTKWRFKSRQRQYFTIYKCQQWIWREYYCKTKNFGTEKTHLFIRFNSIDRHESCSLLAAMQNASSLHAAAKSIPKQRLEEQIQGVLLDTQSSREFIVGSLQNSAHCKLAD